MDDDIVTAQKILDTSLLDVPVYNDQDRAFQDRLKSYGETRSRLMDGMLSMLDRSDPSGVDSDWRDFCSRGLEAIRNLNDQIHSINDKYDLKQLGLEKFYRGETSIWTENARLEIALAFKRIQTCHLANPQLLKQAIEERGGVLSKEKDVEELLDGTFGPVLDILKETSKLLLENHEAKESWENGRPPYMDPIKMLKEKLFKAFFDAVEAAKRKNLIVKTLKTRLEELDKLRKDFATDSIRTTADNARSIAEHLYVIGRDSPFEAKDWEQFGKICREKIECARDVAAEEADRLYGAFYSEIREEMRVMGLALSNREWMWNNWNTEIRNALDSMQGTLDQQQQLANRLKENRFRAGLLASIEEARSLLRASLAGWDTTRTAINEELNRN